MGFDERLDHRAGSFDRDASVAQHPDAATGSEIHLPRSVDHEVGQALATRVGGTTGIEVDDERVTGAQGESDRRDGSQQTIGCGPYGEDGHGPNVWEAVARLKGVVGRAFGPPARHPSTVIRPPTALDSDDGRRRTEDGRTKLVDAGLVLTRPIHSAAMAQAAFFDLDKTVIARSSTLAFVGRMYKAGLMGRPALLRASISQLIYVLFGADEGQLARTRDSLLKLTKGWDRSEVERVVEEALEEIVSPIVYAEALFLIDEHLREGRRVFIVSASPEEVVRPLARYLGVPDVVATRPATDAEGRYTGEVEEYVYGPAKAAAVERLAAVQGIELADSFAYSDSATDLPLLEIVGYPHAVNPDRELREVATERGWPILEFRRQVSLAKRLTRPVPLISGATIAGAVGAALLWVLARRRKRG